MSIYLHPSEDRDFQVQFLPHLVEFFCKCLVVARGVFRGGHWAMAPPWCSQNNIISIEWYAKLWHGPPFVTWEESPSTKTVSKNLFFGQKLNYIWSEDPFFLVFT